MTRIEVYGPRGSGKSRLSELMRKAGIDHYEDLRGLDEGDRHVFQARKKAIVIEQWLRANNYPCERKAGAIVVRLAAKHTRRLIKPTPEEKQLVLRGGNSGPPQKMRLTDDEIRARLGGDAVRRKRAAAGSKATRRQSAASPGGRQGREGKQ